MNGRAGGLRLGLVCLMALIGLTSFSRPAQAQTGALAAFVNGSGQLVVSSADGYFRWIVTNPGESLAQPLGYTWSPDGSRLFFAVNTGAAISLRFAEPAAQTAYEAAQISGASLSGGGWYPDGRGVVISDGANIRLLGADSSLIELVTGQPGVSVFSPYADNRPNLPGASALSPDGRYLFYQQGDGRYAVAALDGSSAFPLPGTNENNVRQSGLWADNAPFVAYWGYEGNSILSVTNAANGQTVTLDSGRAAPIAPLLWRPGTTQLLYRDATGFVRAADMSCLSAGCGASPLDSGVEVLPASASEVVTDGAQVYYADGSSLMTAPLSCIDSNTCAGARLQMAANAAPGLMISARGQTLAYTAFASNPNDVYDRQIAFIALNGCQISGGCAAVIGGGGFNGLLSRGGTNVIADVSGAGVQALDLTTGAATPLSDNAGGSTLPYARWN